MSKIKVVHYINQFFAQIGGAVSYTHLDVYKRQGMYHRSNLIMGSGCNRICKR